MNDIQSLGIEGTIISRASHEAFQKALYRQSELAILEAKYVVFAASFSDIPRVLSYAASQTPPLEIAVKGGGSNPSPWSSSDGGVVIDLSRLNKVVVAGDKRSVTVQGGAVWGDVYKTCQEVGVDVVGGHIWFVGVAGYLLGGGHSPLSGEHGLGIDNIIAATVVLSDGRMIKTSATEEPDLFWAIRGGGGLFGIVVEFVLKAFPTEGAFTVGNLVYPGTEVTKVLKVTQEWVLTRTGKERVSIAFVRAPPHFNPVVLVLPWVSGGASRSKTILATFRSEDLTPIVNICLDVPDLLSVSHAADAAMARAPRRLRIGGAIFSELWTDMVLEVWKRWAKFTDENKDAATSMVLWDTGAPEKISEVGKQETAFCNREPHYTVTIQGQNTSPATDAASYAFVKSTAAYIRQTQQEKTGLDLGIIPNFSQGDEAIEDIYGVNLPRLRKLKAKYDPKKVFSKGIQIEPKFD